MPLLLAVLLAAEFPLARLKALTWVVDYEPAWSPDGARILFDTTSFVGAIKTKEPDRIIGEKIDEKMDLATVRPDGSDLRRLTVAACSSSPTRRASSRTRAGRRAGLPSSAAAGWATSTSSSFLLPGEMRRPFAPLSEGCASPSLAS
jgi:hypothetical protein